MAKLFHVSSQTIINWLDLGRINYNRVGKGPRRIKKIDIYNFIKKGNPDGSPIPIDSLDEKIYNDIEKSIGVLKDNTEGPDLYDLSNSELEQLILKANEILKKRRAGTTKSIPETKDTDGVLESQVA